MELFLVIKCGYEGIEELVFPTENQKEAADKVLDLRKKILDAKEKRKNILENCAEKEEDENYQDEWDRMHGRKEIDSEEWENGKWAEPNSYCVMKWNGNRFECCCVALGVEPTETWLM